MPPGDTFRKLFYPSLSKLECLSIPSFKTSLIFFIKAGTSIKVTSDQHILPGDDLKLVWAEFPTVS